MCIAKLCKAEEFKAILQAGGIYDIKVIDADENLVFAKLQALYRKLL